MAASVNEITFLVPGQPGVRKPDRPGRLAPTCRRSAGHSESVGARGRPARRRRRRARRRPAGRGRRGPAHRERPALFLHPENARDLMRAQVGDAGRPRGARSAADRATSRCRRSSAGQASSRPAPRRREAADGGALLDAVEVVTDLRQGHGGGSAAAAATKKVDGQVDAGVYQLSPDDAAAAEGQRPQARGGAGRRRRRCWCSLHGTFVDTVEHLRQAVDAAPASVRALFAALRRPRLRARPSDARRQPDRQRADARGGAAPRRAAASAHPFARRPGRRGAGARPAATRAAPRRPRALRAATPTASTARRLAALAATGASSGRFAVERLVRVACPARGTLLASQAARRLPVGPEVGPRAGRHPGRAGAGRFPRARSRAGAPTRPSCPGSRR